MRNAHQSLASAAIYANAKPERRRPTGMQIVKRDKKSGKVTILRGHDVLTHEVTRKPVATPEPVTDHGAPPPPPPPPPRKVYLTSTSRRFRMTGLSWED